MGRGRGKVTMKQIQNEKTRKSAFIQRKEGLTKKVSEFSKKFGAEACLIVYDGDDGDARPMTWPKDSTVVQSMLIEYEVQKIETAPKKFDVKDYFANRKSTVEGDISRVHKKMVMNKYPTWGRCFNNMEMKHLKDFIDIVDLKIQACNQRISMLKNMQHNDLMQNTAKMQMVAPENVPSQSSHQVDDPMKPLIDISEMIDFTDHIDWDNLMAEHAELDAQHVEFNQKTAEMQSVVPENVPSQSSHQLDDPMKQVIDMSEMIDFTNHIEWDDIMAEHEEWDDQLVEFNDCANQENDVIVSSQSSKPDDPMNPIIDISEMIDFSNHVEWDDQMTELEELDSQQFVEFNDWANQLDVSCLASF
ncbi:agamous MADS-box protein AGL80 [Trifolium repens]|nr:agamous MADS-box protein AGL80 [Trifolium repens]